MIITVLRSRISFAVLCAYIFHMKEKQFFKFCFLEIWRLDYGLLISQSKYPNPELIIFQPMNDIRYYKQMSHSIEQFLLIYYLIYDLIY